MARGTRPTARRSSLPAGLRQDRRDGRATPNGSSRRTPLRPLSRAAPQETQSLRDVQIWSAFHTWTWVVHFSVSEIIVLTVSEQTNSAFDPTNPAKSPQARPGTWERSGFQPHRCIRRPATPSTPHTVGVSGLKPIDWKKQWIEEKRGDPAQPGDCSADFVQTPTALNLMRRRSPPRSVTTNLRARLKELTQTTNGGLFPSCLRNHEVVPLLANRVESQPRCLCHI